MNSEKNNHNQYSRTRDIAFFYPMHSSCKETGADQYIAKAALTKYTKWVKA